MTDRNFRVENVGLNFDTLSETVEDGVRVIRGVATIHTTDENGAEEYWDDFEFNYNADEDFICCDLSDDIWCDKMPVINEMLIENLKINFIK